jgi:hypothetical protein
MLVKIARDWFDRNGVFHAVRDGLVELPDDYDLGEQKEKGGKPYYSNLPPGAVIMSKTATLPSSGVPAKPGFQAKSDNEQLLDLIPHAGPLDAMVRTDNSRITKEEQASVEKMAKLVAEATKPGNAAQTPAEKVTAQVSQTAPGRATISAASAEGKKVIEPNPGGPDDDEEQEPARTPAPITRTAAAATGTASGTPAKKE